MNLHYHLKIRIAYYCSTHTSRLLLLAVCIAVTAVTVACSGPEPTPEPTPTPDPQVVLGERVYASECGSCHSLSTDTVIVGPSFAGIATRAGTRVEGVTAQNYLLKSILAPDSYVVEGFEPLMPADLGKKLTGEEMDAVVAFLLTLE